MKVDNKDQWCKLSADERLVQDRFSSVNHRYIFYDHVDISINENVHSCERRGGYTAFFSLFQYYVVSISWFGKSYT